MLGTTDEISRQALGVIRAGAAEDKVSKVADGAVGKVPVPREALRRAREAVNMTQAELAAASGCTVATISDLESGRNKQPSHTKVVSIVRALRNNGLPGAMIEDLFPVALVPLTPRRAAPRTRRKSRWTAQHPRT